MELALCTVCRHHEGCCAGRAWAGVVVCNQDNRSNPGSLRLPQVLTELRREMAQPYNRKVAQPPEGATYY